MLSLSLLPGEYLTIGDNIVLQYDDTKSSRCHLNISAPREIPILRGEVHERQGGKRPDCVFEKDRYYRKEVPWNQNKARALRALRQLLDEMEDSGQAQALRQQLDQIFPASKGESSKEAEQKMGSSRLAQIG